MKHLSKRFKAFLMCTLIAAVLITFFETEAANTNYKWNPVEYSSGRPVMSILMNSLDSAANSQSAYENGIISQFDAQTMTMAATYKAPANDTALIIWTTKSTTKQTGVKGWTDQVYNVDTQKVIGHASYVYTTQLFNFKFSSVGNIYSVVVQNQHAASGTANRLNDTLEITLVPQQLNGVPPGTYRDYFGR